MQLNVEPRPLDTFVTGYKLSRLKEADLPTRLIQAPSGYGKLFFLADGFEDKLDLLRSIAERQQAVAPLSGSGRLRRSGPAARLVGIIPDSNSKGTMAFRLARTIISPRPCTGQRELYNQRCLEGRWLTR